MKKTIGILILVSLGLSVLGGVMGAGDGYYTFVGVCFFVVGVWGAVLLIRK